MKRLGFTLSLCLAACSLTAAQSTPPDAPQPQQSQLKKFFTFSPSLDVAKDTLPMSVGEKFEMFARDTVNPFQFFATAAWAGISQARDQYPSWGQGGEGYGKRYGAGYADAASSHFFGDFFFPSILHQDPRYFRKEHGSFGSRLGYVVSRVFVTRMDSGNSAPNYSLWLGSGASAAISNIYYPVAQQTAGETLQRLGINIATAGGFDFAREFWPDVSRKIFHHNRK